jgi:hypothetical protein
MTTAEPARGGDPFADMSRKPAKEEKIDAASVFSKLKTLKRDADDE